jgi:hypothetical protein
VSIAQLAPIQRLRRPVIAMLAGSILTPPPAAPPAFAMQVSPETARPVLRVRQASIKSRREMQHASTVRPGNTQHRRRPWAVMIALPIRTPRQAAQSVAATLGSRVQVDNALRARRASTRRRRDLQHAQSARREPFRLPPRL